MKNNLKLFLLYFLVLFNFFSNLQSNEIKFEAENIETIDKNFITASKNIVISDSNGNKIYGDKLTIENEEIYTITGNVIFKNTNNSIELKSEKIIYNVKNNSIKTVNDTLITKDNLYLLKGDFRPLIIMFPLNNFNLTSPVTLF